MTITKKQHEIADTVVRTVLQRWSGRALWMDRRDLYQEAWVAALEGLRRARPGSNAMMLHAYLRPRVHGALANFAAASLRHAPTEYAERPCHAPTPEQAAAALELLPAARGAMKVALGRLRAPANRRAALAGALEDFEPEQRKSCRRNGYALRMLRRMLAQDLQGQRVLKALREA